MKYLLFDENAISEYINQSSLQSFEYYQGQRFTQHICAELSSELFYNTVIHYTGDGILFVGRKAENSNLTEHNRILCIDLKTCDILKEKDNKAELLAIIQKVFRTCVKIWNHMPFGMSDRYNGSKSIVYPFVRPDGRRVVIERSSAVMGMDRRGIDFPLLAYKYTSEDSPNKEDIVNASVLKLAVREYRGEYATLQKEINDQTSKGETKENNPLEIIQADSIIERDDFIYWNFEKQYDSLTTSQKKVVDYADRGSPLRIEGAAGTGKTLSMIMRAYKILSYNKEQNTAFRIVFFSHNESTCQRNREIFGYYKDGEEFLNEKSKQFIQFTTLLNYCVDFSNSIDINSVLEKDASEAKTFQLQLIDEVLEKAFNDYTIKTYKSIISEDLQILFDESKTSRSVLCRLIQHEFSLQIKARTDGTLDSYISLPSINNGLLCKTKEDKELIYTLFNKYQSYLKTLSQYDMDDVVMEALSRLNAPIWRRERSYKGWDYLFVDEMHLFNLNEQSVFHFLTKDISQKEIPICFALDYSQAIGDRGNTDLDYNNRAFGQKVEKVSYKSVFRNSPQITSFCASIAAAGTLMFQNEFSDPYIGGTVPCFTNEEEEKCQNPKLFMYRNDEIMITSLKSHICNIVRDLHCKYSDIAVISFLNEEYSLDEINSKIKDSGFELLPIKAKNNKDDSCCAFASPYEVNGLEFKAVILLGVDDGRLPQKANVDDISKNFLNYSAYNMLYLSASRAKYRLIILGSKINDISPCLSHSIESNYIDCCEN